MQRDTAMFNQSINKKNSSTVLILMIALTFMLIACDQVPVEDFHLANTTWIGSLTTTMDGENTSVTVKITETVLFGENQKCTVSDVTIITIDDGTPETTITSLVLDYTVNGKTVTITDSKTTLVCTISDDGMSMTSSTSLIYNRKN